MDDFYDPIDFSGIVGYPHDESQDAFENTPDYCDHVDANTHIRAFTKCIDEWCDPPIYEDVLMKLFAITLDMENPYHWFNDSLDGRFKTIQDLLHAFLEGFGHDQSEVYNELVDDFMETWKRKILLAVKTTNLDIKIDAPSNPIEEFNEIIQNVQFPHKEKFEAMNEQFVAIEDQFEIMEDKNYIEYMDPLEIELDSEEDEEIHWEIPNESMDEAVIYFEEVKEFESESVEYFNQKVLI
jgi:hypothetical protein